MSEYKPANYPDSAWLDKEAVKQSLKNIEGGKKKINRGEKGWDFLHYFKACSSSQHYRCSIDIYYCSTQSTTSLYNAMKCKRSTICKEK